MGKYNRNAFCGEPRVDATIINSLWFYAHDVTKIMQQKISAEFESKQVQQNI